MMIMFPQNNSHLLLFLILSLLHMLIPILSRLLSPISLSFDHHVSFLFFLRLGIVTPGMDMAFLVKLNAHDGCVGSGS